MKNMINISSIIYSLLSTALPVLFIGHSEMNQYNEQNRKDKEKALMAVNTGFTNLRQTANLHPAISAGTKKKITAKSNEIQEMLVSKITHTSYPNTKEILVFCETLGKKIYELEQNADRLKSATNSTQKKFHQLAAKNLSAEILTMLEKAPSNDNH